MKKKAKENFESNLDNILLDNSTNPKTYWKIMKMLIKSNKGSNCIPPLRNTINDEHLDEMVYDDDKKCELLNKYFSLVSKLEEDNIPVPPFESKKIPSRRKTFYQSYAMDQILIDNRRSLHATC
jgi:hypothetical protein